MSAICVTYRENIIGINWIIQRCERRRTMRFQSIEVTVCITGQAGKVINL